MGADPATDVVRPTLELRATELVSSGTTSLLNRPGGSVVGVVPELACRLGALVLICGGGVALRLGVSDATASVICIPTAWHVLSVDCTAMT